MMKTQFALGNLSIHMLISIFVVNGKACDLMFSQFIVYALLLLDMCVCVCVCVCVFLNKLICISCMLYATFNVEWSPLKVCSISNKGTNNNKIIYSNFMGLYVLYNAQNNLYEKNSFFP